MAKINATDVSILIGDVEVSNLTNCEIEINREMIDVTTKDSDKWKEILVGLLDWKMNGDITVDFAGAYAPDDIFTSLVAGTSLTLKFGVPGAGNIKYSGSGFYTQLGYQAGVQDKYTAKFNIEGTGALTQISTS